MKVSMKIIMNREMEEELDDLIDIFDGCFVDDEEVICFKVIKKISDEGIALESISKESKAVMYKQLRESFDWLKELNVKSNYYEIFLSYFN